MTIQLKNVLAATSLGFLWLFGAQSVSALTQTEVAKLLPSDGDSEDRFGQSVAVRGTTAVVGAFGDDDISLDSGSAYVFSLTGATGTQGGGHHLQLSKVNRVRVTRGTGTLVYA